ncbi:hypothetical protein F4808DRAFT_132064 [Astrocystis sublimbata]|nr:hypothetical protein F4808DRAFT_132064 [Astrocystis sublimbata]
MDNIPNQKATCPCGRIAMTLPSPPMDISECHCNLCYKLGALWAYYPRDQVAVTTTSPTFPTSTSTVSPAGNTSEHRDKPLVQITRGINTAVDEALESYVSLGDENGATVYRCAHCGALTHRWGVGNRPGEDGDEALMGVNCRLLPEGSIVVTKKVCWRNGV